MTTEREQEELNEIAQWCHANLLNSFRTTYIGAPVIGAALLARTLDDYARLRIEVEALRAQFAEISDDTVEMQRETD